MAYDSRRSKVVMFGGSGGPALADTWEYDGSDWSQIVTATSPSARYYHALTYDTAAGRVVLFGGYAPGTSPYLSDTWQFDGVNWVNRTTIDRPAGLSGPALTYDNVRGRVVLFGGFNYRHVADTWDSDLGILASGTPYGSGCGSPSLTLTQSASRPLLGSTTSVDIVNVPSPLAFVAVGLSRTQMGTAPLPLDLTGYGLPGCLLHQSSDIGAALGATNVGSGLATFAFAVPSQPWVLGIHLYLQAWSPAPGVNPGGLVVSNGVDWLFGNN